MTLVSNDESKHAPKMYEELGVTEIPNDLENYDERCTAIIKFSSDDDLPLKNGLELYNMVAVVRSVFHELNKYYSQVVLVGCFYKLAKKQQDFLIV